MAKLEMNEMCDASVWIADLEGDRRLGHGSTQSSRDASWQLLYHGLLASGYDLDSLGSPKRTAGGKPFFEGGPFFSISRTRGRVAVAISPAGPLGLDLELRRPMTVSAGMKSQILGALRCFGEEHALEICDTSRFIQLWVRLESLIKCEALTLEGVLATVENPLLPNGNKLSKTAANSWSVMELATGVPYCSSLASRTSFSEVHVVEVMMNASMPSAVARSEFGVNLRGLAG